MKDFIKFFSIITGLFRSTVSILLLFAIGFVVFVDNNLLIAFVDILGVNNISRGLLKPICLFVIILAFVINTTAARNIFKAGNDGKNHMSNIFFALIFIALDLAILLLFRERLALILLALNGILLINSLIGLGGKFKGIYKEEEVKKTEYIDVGHTEKDPDSETSKISLNFKDDEGLLEKKTISEDGKTLRSSSRLIKNEPKSLAGEKSQDDEIRTLKDVKEEAKIEEKSKADEPKADTKDDAAKRKSLEGVKEESEPKSLADVKKEAHDIKKVEKSATDPDKNKSTNKVIETDTSDETYGEEVLDKIKKKEEEKIYDRSKFVKEPSEDKKDKE